MLLMLFPLHEAHAQNDQFDDIVVVTVTKVVLGEDRQFEMSAEGVTAVLSDGQSFTFTAIADAFFEIEEVLPPGWSVREAECRGLRANVDYNPAGDRAFVLFPTNTGDVDCIITNGPTPEVTITKNAIGPGGSTTTFNFSAAAIEDVVLNGGESATIAIQDPMRNLVFDEMDIPEPWVPVGVDCVGADSWVGAVGPDADRIRAILFLEPDENAIECTFTNELIVTEPPVTPVPVTPEPVVEFADAEEYPAGGFANGGAVPTSPLAPIDVQLPADAAPVASAATQDPAGQPLAHSGSSVAAPVALGVALLAVGGGLRRVPRCW